jgi:uncharacterized membrane protein YvbJ
MFCTNCGNEIDDKAVVCPKCGVPVQDANANTPTVPNNLVGAILSLFCCLPLGIPAVVFACQVNSKLKAGDIEGAKKAAKTAKVLMIIGIVLGLIIALIRAGVESNAVR